MTPEKLAVLRRKKNDVDEGSVSTPERDSATGAAEPATHAA